MTIKNSFIILLTLTLFSFTNNDKFELVNSPNIVLEKLQKVARKTTSIEALYNEERHISVLSSVQHSKGKFYYQQEDKMRWEQETPIEYIILMAGESLRIKENGKEKKIGENNFMASKVNSFMMSLIQGDYQNNKQLATKCFQSSNEYLIELTPTAKSLKKIYTKFNLYFNKEDCRLQTLEFYEVGGDKRILKFYDQVYNQKIEDSVFINL